jgi:hypothetical protein
MADERLAEMRAIREHLYGPRFRAWLMRFLRGKDHWRGEKGGRWGVGKPILRTLPTWIWTIGAKR